MTEAVSVLWSNADLVLSKSAWRWFSVINTGICRLACSSCDTYSESALFSRRSWSISPNAENTDPSDRAAPACDADR